MVKHKDEEFKVGDLVMLKSGGPVMTVANIDASLVSEYECQWFSGKKLEWGHFHHDVLKPAPKEVQS